MKVPRWAAFVFGLALLARLAFVVLVDQPLLYTHQYHYFSNALAIAEHPQPLRYVWTSDEWRTWDQHWTIAPLYHLFAAAVFRLFGPHLLALRLLQCVLDSLAAVAVAYLGRQAAGPRGAGAGAVYALYFPAVEMASWTMTENLHTPLFAGALALLAHEGVRPSRRSLLLAGALTGLAALARSVSTGFLGLATLWRFWRRQEGRRSWAPAALLAAGGAAVILPWTARNVFVIGEPVLIETAAFENIWWANHFVDRARFHRQEDVVHGQPTPALKREAALHFALRGIQRRPDLFVDKVRSNFWHFLRPEGLQNLVGIERTLEPWRHAASLLLDDLILLAALPFFVAFLAGGRPSPARALIAIWVGYYGFMVIVVFHNEIRYRSAFVPFALAGAAGGIAALTDPARRGRTWAGMALGLALVAGALAPYRVPGWQALRARLPLGQVRDAV
ncbi:MAG TPA: glycosyltransferase family 39 protein, partial [Vicinamibacteria bacterium]